MTLSPWASRSAALAILVVAIGGFWLLFIRPQIDSFNHHRESIRQSQEVLARYRQLDSVRAAMSPSVHQERVEKEREARLLAGGSPQLVGASLQNRLKELIDEYDGHLVSMQVLPAIEEEGFQRISIAVTLRAGMDSLQPILHEIETQTPYLFVENLDLRTGRGIINFAASREAENLNVSFKVYGYMQAAAR